jgi:hypothetical protein
VLRLPAGVRWVASHQPGNYDPPREFADVLTSLPLAAVLPWRHTHQFTPAGPRATRVALRHVLGREPAVVPAHPGADQRRMRTTASGRRGALA